MFSISGHHFVISSTAVREIRSADNLGGVVQQIERPVVSKVRHIVEREAKDYYVVSGSEHFALRISRPGSVLILRDLPVAVLVDGIEEMAEMYVLLALPPSFQGLEKLWYRGLTILGGRVLPVINPKGFLTKEELELLACASGDYACADKATGDSQ